MSPTSKKKSDTLVRVRNNQRRCRARKREYIAELERKVQDLEALGAQVNNQTEWSTVKRLEDENTKLRDLLGLAGFSETWVEAHLKQDNSDGEIADKLQISREGSLLYAQDGANDHLETVPEVTTTDLMPDIYGSGIPTAFDDLFDVPFQLSGAPFDFFVPSLTPPPVDLLSTSKSCDGKSKESSCCSKQSTRQTTWTASPQAPSAIDLSRLKSTSSDSDSTLCSVAFGLVRQYNKKGVDMIDIGIRLWNGFIKGDPDGNGCKVENKLLFSVLEYIST